MDLQDQDAKSSTSNHLSWWIWCCWLRQRTATYFVYGCAAPSSREPGWIKDCALQLAALGQLEIRQKTLADDAFRHFQEELSAGSIRLDLLTSAGAPVATVRATRAIVQQGLGHSAARVTAYYSLPDVARWIGGSEGALKPLLSLLENELNFPFKSSYAARLGNFEIFNLNGWLDRPQPFLIEAAPPPRAETGWPPRIDRTGPETLEICRTPDFAQVRHVAHIAGRAHGDVVIDRMIFLDPGQLRVATVSPEWLDQLDFQLFDETGQTLVHAEQNTYITRIGFVLAPIGRQITVQDELSERAAQQGLQQQASIVQVHSSHRSVIGAPAEGSWRKFAEDMDDLAATQLPTPSQDRWFPRGLEGELGVISHFNQLLSGGHISRAIIVDPWFGASAHSGLVLRLGSQDVHLTIVTSWTHRDPDTGAFLDPAGNPTADLETVLRQTETFVNPRLTVINLADGNDHAFHDRYLLLYPHEGPSKVYLLSNSLNRAAGNWPFCMSLLAPDIALPVRHYIEGLCRGEDTARGRSLRLTF